MSIATFLTDAVGLWKQRQPLDVPLAGKDLHAPDVSDAPPDTRRLIRNRQYCRVLANEGSMPFDDLSIDCAWTALKQDMALVPRGEICLVSDLVVSTPRGFEVISNPDELVSVEAFYLDRDCVTNADYLKFVQSDGYSDPQYWPEEILSNLLQFIDATGCPGPKGWVEGAPRPTDSITPWLGFVGTKPTLIQPGSANACPRPRNGNGPEPGPRDTAEIASSCAILGAMLLIQPSPIYGPADTEGPCRSTDSSWDTLPTASDS